MIALHCALYVGTLIYKWSFIGSAIADASRATPCGTNLSQMIHKPGQNSERGGYRMAVLISSFLPVLGPRVPLFTRLNRSDTESLLQFMAQDHPLTVHCVVNGSLQFVRMERFTSDTGLLVIFC